MQEADIKITILAENNNAICIKIVRTNKNFGKSLKSVRYQIWSDKEKYIKGIATDEYGQYMREIIGSNNACVLEIFNTLDKDKPFNSCQY